jgi:hypothetical protein
MSLQTTSDLFLRVLSLPVDPGSKLGGKGETTRTLAWLCRVRHHQANPANVLERSMLWYWSVTGCASIQSDTFPVLCSNYVEGSHVHWSCSVRYLLDTSSSKCSPDHRWAARFPGCNGTRYWRVLLQPPSTPLAPPPSPSLPARHRARPALG